MKRYICRKFTYAIAAPVFDMALLFSSFNFNAHAGSSVSAYWGTMDTQLFGRGDIVGGALEFTPVPVVSLQLRAAYANNFEKFNITAPSTEGMPQYEAEISNIVFGGLESAGRAQLKDFTVIPLEIGLTGRAGFLDFLGVYTGFGYGYYVVPEFTVASRSGFEHAKKANNISGWWGLVGIEGGIANLKLFAEAKYTRAVARDIDIELEYAGHKGTLNANIDLSGFTYIAGVRLCW